MRSSLFSRRATSSSRALRACVVAGVFALGACAGAAPDTRPSGIHANDLRANDLRANDLATPTAVASGAPRSSLNGPAVDASAAGPPPLNAPMLNAPTALNGPTLNTEMKDPVPTAFAEDLAKLGLSPNALPPIQQLDPRSLRRVMTLITRSLGASCTDCHEASDFGAPTPRKRVATHMWNSFAAGLAMKGGAPLFCDSCHQGRMTFLDRHDPTTLRAWMDRAFVAKLQRTDGQEHNCESCHGAGTGQSGAPFLKTWSTL